MKHTIKNTIFEMCLVPAALILFSCGNMFGTAETSSGTAAAGEGQCSLSVTANANFGRSAFPSTLPDSASTKYVATLTYTSGSTTYYMGAASAALTAETYLTNSASSGQPVFVFAAPTVAAEYTLTVYACKASVNSDYKEHYYSYGSGTVSLVIDQRNAGELTITNFTAVDASSMDSGTGDVSLGLSLDTALGVSTVSVAVTATGSTTSVTGFTASAVLNDSCTISATGIASGTYIMTMTFKNASGTAIAVSNGVQVVTVCAGCTTNKWYDDTDTSSGGTDALTITAASAQKVFYVCGTSPSVYGNSIASSTYTTEDTNNGTILAPFATVPAAVNKIIAANDGTSTYYIYIDGTCTDSSSNSYTATNNSAYINISTDKSLTLVIQPFGSAQATINACRNSTKTGRVLYVSGSSVNLTLTNLTLKGGYSDNGGGIYMNSGTLTLATCSITGNTATESGGGLYAAGGAIITSGTTSISGNTGVIGEQYYITTGATFNGTAGAPTIVN